MCAVAETTPFGTFEYLKKIVGNLFYLHVVCSETLDTRSIDKIATGHKLEHFGVGGGVHTLVVYAGYFADARRRFGRHGIDQAGLSDTGISREQRYFAGDYPLQFVDTRTGGPAVAGTPPTCCRTELATKADKERLPAGRYDSQGRAILDARYADWYAGSQQKHLYALDDDRSADIPPAILIPAEGSTITLEPTMPGAGALVELKSTLPPAAVRWQCPTLSIENRNGRWYARLRPGTHTIRAQAPPDLHAEATFHVSVNAPDFL